MKLMSFNLTSSLPRMTRVLVAVQLKILVIQQKCTPIFVDGEVIMLLLGEHVVVVSLGQGRPYFHNLDGWVNFEF